jgi:dienelactone hydrolase
MDQYIKNQKENNSVSIKAGNVVLNGNIVIPNGARGIVLFVHGSGSSRFSPRNRFVAEELNKKGLATLLFDLLTQEEEIIDEKTAQLRFDIELLAKRLVKVTDWVQNNPETKNLNIGYFGASTGAGAALVAAAERPNVIKAVVSRGGRPDLAGRRLVEVECPTLLIVGGYDGPVIEMNRDALAHLKTEKNLVIVPGATHLFEERGKLEEVAIHAGNWFLKYLGGPKQN